MRPGLAAAQAERATSSIARIVRSTLRQVSFARSVVGPAAVGQRGQEPGVAGHVLQPLGQPLDAVVVAAETDVVDPGDLAHVLDVGDDVGEADGRRRHRLRVRRLHLLQRRDVARVDALATASAPMASAPSRAPPG